MAIFIQGRLTLIHGLQLIHAFLNNNVLQMFDWDQSYLLNSYNQNQQLFANLDHSAITHYNQAKRPNLSADSDASVWRGIEHTFRSRVHDSRQNADLSVGMLGAIDEDAKEGEHTASKGNKGGGDRRQGQGRKMVRESLSVVENRQVPRMKSSSNWGKNSADYIRQDRDVSTKKSEKQHNKQATGGQQNSLLIQQQSEADKFCPKSIKQFQNRIDWLQRSLTQIYKKYSAAAKTLLCYEEVIRQMQQLVESQQGVISTLCKQLQHQGHRFDKLFSTQVSHNETKTQESHATIKAVRAQISRVISRFTLPAVSLSPIAFETEANEPAPISPLNHAHSAWNNIRSVPLLPFPQCKQPHHFNEPSSLQPTSLGLPYNVDIGVQCALTGCQRQASHRGHSSTNIDEPAAKRGHVAGCTVTEFNVCHRGDEEKQAPGENYRKLANFRIKQLQTLNSNLANEVSSLNSKFMVVRNENKELREIVEGLIQQVKNYDQKPPCAFNKFY